MVGHGKSLGLGLLHSQEVGGALRWSVFPWELGAGNSFLKDCPGETAYVYPGADVCVCECVCLGQRSPSGITP